MVFGVETGREVERRGIRVGFVEEQCFKFFGVKELGRYSKR